MDSKYLPAAPAAATHNGHGRANGNGSVDGSGKANGNGTLNVNGNGHGSGSSAMNAGQPAVDSDITARIRFALGLLPHPLDLHVGVDTCDGVVTLTRLVGSRRQTEAAVAIAAQVAGVKYVNDHLVANLRPSRVDSEPPTRRIPGPEAGVQDDRHE